MPLGVVEGHGDLGKSAAQSEQAIYCMADDQSCSTSHLYAGDL